MMRFVVLDTETTGFVRGKGLSVCHGHRIIEVACVEIEDGVCTGNDFHVYVDPGMDVDPAAVRVHGITSDFLRGKPQFKDIADALIAFIGGSPVVIHNAPFDIAFLDNEFNLLVDQPTVTFKYIDTLELAREMFPGFKNDLNSLCARAGFDGRGKHGALVDARLLAGVFLKLFI